MRTRKHFMVLLLCILISVLSVFPSAAASDEILLSGCEAESAWSKPSGWMTRELDKTSFTEGNASVKYTLNLGGSARNFALEHWYGPINATGCNAFAIDFYISDPNLFGHCDQAVIELTSAGTCDSEESYWGFNFDIKAGWNTLIMPITPNTCVMSRLNYFRIYALGIQPYTSEPIVLAFDNFRCIYDDPAQYEPNINGVAIGTLYEATEKADAALPSQEPYTYTETETYQLAGILPVAIGLFGVAAVLLVVFLIFVCKKKTAIKILSLILCLVFSASGAVALVLYQMPHYREIAVPIPQMGAEEVESKLTVDWAYSTKEDYKIFYQTPEEKSELAEELKKYDFRQPTLIATERNPEQYMVAVTSVIAFGARGDGISNDTVAFREAVDYAARVGGGTVFVPAGRYVLNGQINIPRGVTLAGELVHGTTDGTVLMIYGGKGKESASPAILMEFQSGIKNVAFWYPEQKFVNGEPIPYPPTIRQNGSEGITVENVNFVNSYFAIDMANGALTSNSLQTIRDITGTPLLIGTDNDNSLDIGRFENIDFDPKYWLLSGLDDTPEQQLLTTWLLRNAVAIRIGRVDWTYYTDISINGYKIGIEYYVGSTGSANGHLYNANITDCYYPIVTATLSHLTITKSTLRATGNNGAVALLFRTGAETEMNLSFCELTTTGMNAIYNNTSSTITLHDCSVTSSKEGTPFVTSKRGLYTAVNTTFVGKETAYTVTSAPVDPIPEADYNRVVVTKPTSTLLVNLKDAPYEINAGEDITEKLQSAIDSLKETGGTVYIPGGTYKLSGAVTVHDGIEICGAQDVPHYFPHTTLQTDYGVNDPNGAALFTLKTGAGLRGIGILYNSISRHGSNLPPYAYTVRGDGTGVYVVNCTIPFTYNGIDFATNRCDHHYIEYLWGCAANNAISVGGGSENGIIRDCMFTQNTSWTVADGEYLGITHPMLIANSTTFRVGQTKNQILYHTFVFGAKRGLEINDGAENCFVLSHGTDYGNIAVYLSGNATATLVDTQMVTREGVDRSYIQTAEDFVGKLTIYNGSAWGTPNVAFLFRGAGDYRIYQLHISDPGNDTFELYGGSLRLSGIARFGKTKYDVEVIGTATKVEVNGCLFMTKPKYSIPDSVEKSGNNIK